MQSWFVLMTEFIAREIKILIFLVCEFTASVINYKSLIPIVLFQDIEKQVQPNLWKVLDMTNKMLAMQLLNLLKHLF